MSQRDRAGAATPMAMPEEKSSFHRFMVPTRLVAPLERLYAMEGKFWAGSIVEGTIVATAMVKMLGEAMLLVSRRWNSLSADELNLLVKSVDAARGLGFKVTKMEPVAATAKKLLCCREKFKVRKEVTAEIGALKRKLEAIDKEIYKLVGDVDIISITSSDLGI